jgi:hypothetical protein
VADEITADDIHRRSFLGQPLPSDWTRESVSTRKPIFEPLISLIELIMNISWNWFSTSKGEVKSFPKISKIRAISG